TLGASENHLAKIMQRLGKAELVSSTRGPSGGFRLNRPAAHITLMQIYEVIEGPFTPEFCLLKKPICQGQKCVLGGLISRINQEVRNYLTTTTLADLRDVCAPVTSSSTSHLRNHRDANRMQTQSGN
ncbi:MAG: Rrf2 family transcriptional regulator, partial [Sedimentisphaerales bacterium]|nr:Rrf2 family transcriptional regulator [Sedimentisphaerales bacterium]